MESRKINAFIKKVLFNNEGLVPVVVQDFRDNTVLMVAYMNRESLTITIREGKTCFWSRSRKKLWRKGESSGNQQQVKHMLIDCDGDCLVIKVNQVGGAACHTGHRSCFYRKLARTGSLTVIDKPLFDPEKVYK